MPRAVIRLWRSAVTESVFRSLEREVAFPRGRIRVNLLGDSVEVVCEASDYSSLRSLVNTVLRSAYIVAEVESMHE